MCCNVVIRGVFSVFDHIVLTYGKRMKLLPIYHSGSDCGVVDIAAPRGVSSIPTTGKKN